MTTIRPRSRRAHLALAGIGIAALMAGAGVGWWRLAPSGAAPEASRLLFEQTFPDADGRPQPLEQWRGKLLVVNFWATWCPPCVEEMPQLQRIRDDYAAKGVEIIGLGIDQPAKIRDFRDRHGITLPLLVAGAGGSELGRLLGNPSGALPYTVLITPRGEMVRHRLGQIGMEELGSWLDAEL